MNDANEGIQMPSDLNQMVSELMQLLPKKMKMMKQEDAGVDSMDNKDLPGVSNQKSSADEAKPSGGDAKILAGSSLDPDSGSSKTITEESVLGQRHSNQGTSGINHSMSSANMQNNLRVMEFQISPKKSMQSMIAGEVNPAPECKMSGYDGDSASGNSESDFGCA